MPSPENWSSVPSNWLTSGPNNVEDPFLLVERRYRLRSNDLPPRRVHGLERDVFVHHANRVCDQIAAIVDLGHNPLGVVFAVKHDRLPRPLDRRVATGAVIQHVPATAVIPAGDDQPGFVSLLAAGHRRVDRYDDAREVGHALANRPAQFFVQRARPQRARDVVQDLGVELLPAEPRTLVFADDLGEEAGREIAVGGGKPLIMSISPQMSDRHRQSASQTPPPPLPQ